MYYNDIKYNNTLYIKIKLKFIGFLKCCLISKVMYIIKYKLKIIFLYL